MIGKGYYIKARKIQDSEIAHAPPHVREIWDYFLREANHQEVKKYGKTIQRGQLIRTYGDIIEALHWMVGWRKMSYSKSDCETAMKYLKKRAMVLTEKTTRGMVVTVCNYDTYQDPKHYENHKEGYSKPTGEPQSDDTINKNGRKKELKNYTVNDFSFLGDERFAGLWNDYLKSRKTKLNIIGQKASLKKLHKYTLDISCKALEKSIESGYTGLFPESIKPNKPTPTRPSIVMDKIYT